VNVIHIHSQLQNFSYICVCVCVSVCARARACVRACVRASASVCVCVGGGYKIQSDFQKETHLRKWMILTDGCLKIQEAHKNASNTKMSYFPSI
jgi:hypothetical protein